MTRRSPQAQVALIAALVFFVVGVTLLAVLTVGLIDGVTGSGPLVLAALALGVFALGGRLLMLSRRPAAQPAAATATPPKQAAKRQPAARPTGQRPRPGPRGRPAGL